jgi:hypothetical protein
MTVAIRRDIVSISDIETVYEIREDDSPRVGFDIPRGQVPVKVLHACSTFNLRN